MPRLSKRDVERLLDCYDIDPVGALREALEIVDADRDAQEALSLMSTMERDALLRDLVEWRGLTPPDL